MLSRSALETQKLELMSAMSELKFQHAALERENVELRATNRLVNSTSIGGISKPPPFKPRMSPQPQHSTPVYHGSNQVRFSNQLLLLNIKELELSINHKLEFLSNLAIKIPTIV